MPKSAAAILAERSADGERRLKAKARIAAARTHCNLIAVELRTAMDTGYWRNMVASGQLVMLALPGLNLLKLRGAGGWRRPPAGAEAFLGLMAQLVANWYLPGQREQRYTGAQLTTKDICAALDISPSTWTREALEWLVHHEFIDVLPTAVTPPATWRSKRHGRNMRARESTPLYIPGRALLELLKLRAHRIALRLRRIARKLRSQSSGVSALRAEPSGLSGSGLVDAAGEKPPASEAAEKPAAAQAADVPRESALTWKLLARTTPWKSKRERRERRDRRREASKGGGVDGAGGELERRQASPVAPQDAIAASVPSAPAAPAPLPWEPPSSPRFAAPPSLDELRAALAGVRGAVDAAPDRVIAPMMPDGESQRLDEPTKPAAIAGVLAAILAKGKP